MFDAAIIGGGLAGLINAILLSREGLEVVLFEKKSYPFHRVCGEYVSNEVRPFLHRNDLFPYELDLPNIKNLSLTSVNGWKTNLHLDLGGFGISRFALDSYFVGQARSSGVRIMEKTTIDQITFGGQHYHLQSGRKSFKAKVVIGAHGKRSKLDAIMKRGFMTKKSPYLAVKYHIKTDLPSDVIALHNFRDGYCGVSQVENNVYNLCYLSHRDNLRAHGDIETMENAVLHRNPFLKSLFENSDFIFDKPLVINEVTFEKKKLVQDGVFMSGDSAGMITPLCGNGMAMAIHSAKLLSESISRNWKGGSPDLASIEKEYVSQWNHFFSLRLSAGRKLQRLFGADAASIAAVALAKLTPIANQLIKLTHGRAF